MEDNDLTSSPMWDNGGHFGLHEAGMDLTKEFDNAPHGDEVFEGKTIVGELVDESIDAADRG